MSHKFNEVRQSLSTFCITMKTLTQPYQLNPILMVSNIKVPAYEFTIVIKGSAEGTG